MIEIPCIYCGNTVRTDESAVLRHVKCHACGHSIPVKSHKPDHARQAAQDSQTHTPDTGKDWADISDEEIAAQLLLKTLSKEDSDRQSAKLLLSPLLPKYDDLKLFAMSLAFLLLALTDAELRQLVTKAFSWTFGPRITVLFLFACFGMVCSLVNIFLQKKKSEIEKWAMLLFAILVTSGTGIYTGWLMLKQSHGWLIIFPALNILNGGLLLLLTRTGIIDTECIISKKTAFGQIVITAVAVPILITTCLYLFELHWAVTFSITTVYTMNLHNTLCNFLEPRD